MGFDSVLADLARLRFDAEWCTVRASDIGAPHRRERLYVLARNTGGIGDTGTGLRQSDTLQDRDVTPSTSRFAANADDTGLERPKPTQRHILPARCATANADSGTVRTEPVSVAERSGPVVTRLDGTPFADSDLFAFNDVRASDEQRHPCKCVLDFGQYQPAVERWEHLHGPAPQPLDNGRLNPRFVEWMMGYPAGWITDITPTRTHALKMLGNAVVPQAATHALTTLMAVAT